MVFRIEVLRLQIMRTAAEKKSDHCRCEIFEFRPPSLFFVADEMLVNEKYLDIVYCLLEPLEHW